MTVTFLPSPNHASRNGVKITDIVLHWMDGTLAAADATFANAAGETSAHYGVEGSVVHQYVADADTAWHSGDWNENQRSIGIEHSAEPGRDATPETIASSVALQAFLCRKYGIDPSHIYPHNKFFATQCPGTLPVAAMVAAVRAQLASPSSTPPSQEIDMTPEQATILGTTGWALQTLRTAEAMHFTALSVQVTALTAAVAALAGHADLSADQITKIINDAIAAQVKVTGTLTVTPVGA